MTKTVTRLYDRFSDAAAAVGEVEGMGLSRAEISLVIGNAEGAHSHRGKAVKAEEEAAADKDAAVGLAVGGVIGGAGGLVAGLGLMTIPGLGPVVAAGWLISTVLGATSGAATGGAAVGLVSSLIRADLDEKAAKAFAEGVRRGGCLVSVRVNDADHVLVMRALDRFSPADLDHNAHAREPTG